MNEENRNIKKLKSFTAFCSKYPQLRFWQALRAWAGVSFVYTSDKLQNDASLQDTFYIE